MSAKRGMRVAVRAWHVPYLYNLARALPDVRFHALPSPYNQTGWNYTQRPLPPNVTQVSYLDRRYDLLLAQALQDLDLARTVEWDKPIVYLSHNRHEFEGRSLALWLQDRTLPLVCISEMKAETWRNAGYLRPITIIKPGIDVSEFPLWDGGDQKDPHILTVANNLWRPLFDGDAWVTATEGLPVRLIGEGSDRLRGAVGPSESWDALKEAYRSARVYLNPTRAPYEDSHNLALLEARATGMPWVSLWDSPPDRARSCLERWLRREWAAHPSEVRANVALEFPITTFAERWRGVLLEATRG